MEIASAKGSLRLLEYLSTLEWPGLPHSFRQQRLDHALNNATFAGRVDVLNWWMTKYLPAKADAASSRIFKLACKYQRLNVLKWLDQAGRIPVNQSQFSSEVRCDSMELAIWLYEHVRGICLALSITISNDETIRFIQWGHRHEFEISGVRLAMDNAAALGRLEDLCWLHENRLERCSCTILGAAAANGHVRTFKWLCDTYAGDDLDDPVRGCADWKMIKWILSEYSWKAERSRELWFENSLTAAVKAQDDELTKFLLRIQPELNTESALSIAAERGDLELVKLLAGLSWRETDETMNSAISCGHLNIVKWLYQHEFRGCSSFAMDQAASNGHLETLQWLHDNQSVKCTTLAMDMAAKHGHYRTVAWLFENQPQSRSIHSLEKAAAGGHLQIVEFLFVQELEFNLNYAIVDSAINGHFHVFRWLYERIPVLDYHDYICWALEDAAYNGHLNIVQYLDLENYSLENINLKILGSERGQFTVFEWIMTRLRSV